MSSKPEADGRTNWLAVGIIFSVVFILCFFFLIAVKIGVIPLDWRSEILDFTPLTELKLSEWGDFAAGIGGTLALVWLIISTKIQSDELSGQQVELSNQTSALQGVKAAMTAQKEAMDAQVDALRQQSASLQEELERTHVEQAWTDTLALISLFRELVPVNNAFLRWQFEGDVDPICLTYQPPEDLNPIALSDFAFLFRATGGVKISFQKLQRRQLNAAKLIKCPNSARRLEQMKRIIDLIIERRKTMPDHRRAILDECRLDEWNEMFQVLFDCYFWSPNLESCDGAAVVLEG